MSVIEYKKLEANKMLLGLESSEKDYSSKDLRNKLKIASAPKKSVEIFFNEVIERLEKANRVGYANVFKSTKNSLVTFIKGKNLEFTEINSAFINKYEEAFLERGVTLNSIFVFMRTFKTLINYARKEGIVKPEFDPFKEISFTKYRRVKTKKRAITKEQFRLIEQLELKTESSLFHSRNYFLFSFYNRGMNFIDLAFLKWENLKKNRLEYVRSKTKERFTIGMLDPAIAIFNYYKENYASSSNGYVFPILNDSYKTPKSIDYRVDKMLKVTNKDLKEIALLAGIDEKLTTYVARHSYATILKRSGVSTSIISEALGHESEKTTQIYLDSFENNVLDEASKAIL